MAAAGGGGNDGNGGGGGDDGNGGGGYGVVDGGHRPQSDSELDQEERTGELDDVEVAGPEEGDGIDTAGGADPWCKTTLTNAEYRTFVNQIRSRPVPSSLPDAPSDAANAEQARPPPCEDLTAGSQPGV